MTKENYTQLTNQELVNSIQSIHNFGKRGFPKFLRCSFPELFQELITRTSFMDKTYIEHNHVVPFMDRIFCVENNLNSLPTCQNPDCDNNVEIGRTHCCSSCSMKDPITQNKTQKTCIERYGVANAFQSKSVQEKHKQTMLKNHGCENPSQVNFVKEKKKSTTMMHFGVENPSQSKEIQEKRQQTFQEKYHANSYMETQEFREKSKKSCMKHFGVEYSMQSEEVRKKAKKTCREIYGVENAAQSNLVKEKMRQTTLLKLGVEYAAQSPEIIDKIKQTKKERYNNENFNNRKQAKQTNLERYGVENYAQSNEYHKKEHKRYTNPKYPYMTFDSSWEFIVYDFLLENKINFEYQPPISISYEYKGTKHTYHPDFLVNGKIYEVKGDNFFRINESSGKEEMFCPYRNKDWSNEKYEWMCGLYEAKHQCMNENGVAILRQHHIKTLTIEIFE